jgi:hypothetical protein
MSYSVPKSSIIDYPPSALKEFHLYGFEWVDNLHFIQRPADYIPEDQVESYLDIARERFREDGWEGDGDIGLLWLPPFVLPDIVDQKRWQGVVAWFVKQSEDGLSWILSPVELPWDDWDRINMAPWEKKVSAGQA